MSEGITEPEALKVQWLEDGLLVHGITLAATGPAMSRVHAAAAATLLLLLGAIGLAANGWPWVALPLGVAGVGCAVVFVQLGLAQARAAPAAPRRLLVELGRTHLSWTSLAGDRWSMQHDHRAPLTDVLGAEPAGGAEGAGLRILLRGEAWEIPLHGVPEADVRWLAARIGEAAAAARGAEEAETPA
ncbi:MAG: hypothetical protein R3F59_34680 [Myxococcota bacterium]